MLENIFMFLWEIFYTIFLPWIRLFMLVLNSANSWLGEIFSSIISLKIFVFSLRTSQLSWHWTKLVLFNRQPLPTCCGTPATATSTTCRARSPCPSLAMPSCLPSPRRRSSRWVNINVHNAGNLVHIHFVLRCSPRQSHNMDPSYVSILVTGQMPFSQHQRWSRSLCLFEHSLLTVPSPPPQAFEKVLSSNAHITKGHDYRPLLPWLGTGLLTSTGAKWHTRWSFQYWSWSKPWSWSYHLV